MPLEPAWINQDPFFSLLHHLLQRHHPRRLKRDGFKPAAVTLLLWRMKGQPHLLFIRRSDRVRYHKGEISFPGGHKNPQDKDLSQTACRETWEEVGVPQERMVILGRLDDAFTLSRYLVSPYVAAIPAPHPFQASAEVAELIPLPLSQLFHPNRFSLTFRTLGQQLVPVYTYEFDHRVIWGATARILKNFLCLLNENPDLHRLIGNNQTHGVSPQLLR